MPCQVVEMTRHTVSGASLTDPTATPAVIATANSTTHKTAPTTACKQLPAPGRRERARPGRAAPVNERHAEPRSPVLAMLIHPHGRTQETLQHSRTNRPSTEDRNRDVEVGDRARPQNQGALPLRDSAGI